MNDPITKEGTPRPWRVAAKNRIWYAGSDPNIGNVEIAEFGDMGDKELVPFNAKRWEADCALAVHAVNTFDEREARITALEEERDALRTALHAAEIMAEIAATEVGSRITALETENARLREALTVCEEYFDQRADAEYTTDSARPVGNVEMDMLVVVRKALNGE